MLCDLRQPHTLGGSIHWWTLPIGDIRGHYLIDAREGTLRQRLGHGSSGAFQAAPTSLGAIVAVSERPPDRVTPDVNRMRHRPLPRRHLRRTAELAIRPIRSGSAHFKNRLHATHDSGGHGRVEKSIEEPLVVPSDDYGVDIVLLGCDADAFNRIA